MKYLSTNGETFGFKDSKYNIITDTDIKISDEVYNKYFELHNIGHEFKIKDANGTTFDEIFEEIVPIQIVHVPSEIELRISALENLQLQQEGLI